MAMTKKPAVRKPAVKRPSAKPVPLAPAPKRPAPTSTTRRPAMPKTAKRAPLETQRVGGIISIPKKPKKTIY